jgi:periplasmic protein TonB
MTNELTSNRATAPSASVRKPQVKIAANDRLGMTLLVAGMLHAVAALGVTFQAEDASSTALPDLDVILVQSRSAQAPEKADFLAQANQIGGGDSEQKLRPSDLFSAPVPKPEPGIAPMPVEASEQTPQERIERDTEVLTVRHSTRIVPTVPSQSEVEQANTLNTRDVTQRAMEMARLQAEISRNRQAYAKRPKRKFISANTKEDGYAQYMQAWVAKVERVGNINYPDEARARELQGSLVLTVAIRRDGSVERIEIIQSSGEAILDDAAKHIVEIAAPFDITPEVNGERFDVLHITRTWQFLPGNVLESH